MKRGVIAAGLSVSLHLGIVLVVWGNPPPAEVAQPVPVRVEVMRLAGLVSGDSVRPANSPNVQRDNQRVTGRRLAAIAANAPVDSQPSPAVGAAGAAGDDEELPSGSGDANLDGPQAGDSPPQPASLDTAALSRRLQEVALRCYPPAARRFRQTGEAQVRFCLDASGTLRESTVSASSGSELLDHAASDCVVPGAAPFGPETHGRCFTVPVRFLQ